MQIKQDPEIKRTVCYENNSTKANCFFYASNEPKSVLARDLGDCRDNQNWSTGPILICNATSQSLLFFRNTYRGFSFNQLRMQKECADGNMIEKAG